MKNLLYKTHHTFTRNLPKFIIRILIVPIIATMMVRSVSAEQSENIRKIKPSDFSYVGDDLYISEKVTENQKKDLLAGLELLPDRLITALEEDNIKIYAYPSSESTIIRNRAGVRGAYVYTQPVHRYIQVLSDPYIESYSPAWTVIHEIGHAVSDHAQRHPDKNIFYEAKTVEWEQLAADQTELKALKSLDPIGTRSFTQTGKLSTSEYFAEVFAMVYVNPTYMTEYCPKLTAYINKVTQSYLSEHTQQ